MSGKPCAVRSASFNLRSAASLCYPSADSNSHGPDPAGAVFDPRTVMAFKGTLDSLSMTDVLQVVAMAHKSGCMRVEHPCGEAKRVYFEGGDIVTASSTSPKDRLGELLVKMSLLTPEQLDASRSAEQVTGVKQGAVLVENGVLTEAQLHKALSRQIREIFFSLMVWHEGTFEFIDGEVPGPDVFRVEASVTSLIMEGTRQLDEWSLIEKVFPSLDVVLSMSFKKGGGDVHLQPDEWEVLTLIDGKRTIREICAQSASSNFDVCKKLLTLHHAGLLSVRTPTNGHSVAKREPTARVPAGFAAVVREEFTRLVGPIADILLVETEETLGVTIDGLPLERVDDLLSLLRNEIDVPSKAEHFQAQIRQAAAG